MHNDPKYATVSATLPESLPPISMECALEAYKKLVSAFGKAKDMPVNIAEMRLNAPIVSRRTHARRCWASTKATKGHHNGWGRLIHDASHYVFNKRHPNARPHDGGHATLEREMATYVMAHNLIGRFTTKIKSKPSQSEKLARVELAIIRWESKHRRATNALRKLNAKRNRLTKLIGGTES